MSIRLTSMYESALSARMSATADMSLTPGFLLGVQVLQMTALELVAEIDAECARNELILHRQRPPRVSGDPDDRHAMLGQVPARPIDLLEHVRIELGLLDLEPDLAAAVLALASALDDRGYLTQPREQLSAQVGGELLGPALAVLLGLPPGGLGASGPIEAMLAQLAATDPDRPMLSRILSTHLEGLAHGDRDRVAAELGVSASELTRLLARVRSLEPRPAAWFQVERPQARIPDLTVTLDGSQLTVRVANDAFGSLRIDRRLVRLASAAQMPRDSRREVAAKLVRARAVIRAIDSRGATLERIATAVFARQLGFLRHGRAALRKLAMSDVAQELGLHVSTVSRAVRGKVVATDHGSIELREFFLPGGARNGLADRDAIVQALRGMLAVDPHSSDAAVTRRLAELGLAVARRTVAKYRAEIAGRRRSPRA